MYIYGLIYETSVCVCACTKSLHLCRTLCTWTVACQAPLSMGFFRQEYWSELLWPPPRDLPSQGGNIYKC